MLFPTNPFPTLWCVVGISGEFSQQIKKYFARLHTELFPEWPLCVGSLLPTNAKPRVGFSGCEREVMWKRDVCPLDHYWLWNAADRWLPRLHGKVFYLSFKQINYCCVFPKWCFIFAFLSWIKLSLFPTRKDGEQYLANDAGDQGNAAIPAEQAGTWDGVHGALYL